MRRLLSRIAGRMGLDPCAMDRHRVPDGHDPAVRWARCEWCGELVDAGRQLEVQQFAREW